MTVISLTTTRRERRSSRPTPLRILLAVTLVALFAWPTSHAVLAQAEPCPEPNNGFNTACYIGSASPSVQGVIASADDVDAYKFTVLEPLVQARITLSDVSGDYDLHVFNGVAAFLAETGSQGASTAELELTLPPNHYFIFVNSSRGEFNPSKPYTLSITTRPIDPASITPTGEGCRGARAGGDGGCLLNPPRPVADSLQFALDARTYRFEVGQAGSRVVAELSNATPELGLALTAADGTSLGRLTGSGFLARRLGPGSYFVKVAPNAGLSAPSPFTLMVSVTPPESIPVAQNLDLCPEPNDTHATSCALSPDRTVSGYISNPGDLDYYAFDVPADQTWVHVELTNLPADFGLEIEDVEERTIVSSHNSGPFPEALDVVLKAGRYFILVDSIVGQGSDTKPYTLSLSEVPLSARARPRSSVLLADNFNFLSTRFANVSDSGSYELGVFDGEYVIKMHDASSPGGRQSLEDLSADQVPLEDFRLDLDARVSKLPATNGGVSVSWHAQQNGRYVLYVDPLNGAAKIARYGSGAITDLTSWVTSPAIRRGSESNHLTVISEGPRYTVLINDQRVLEATDDTLRAGVVALGAATWDQPTEVRYRNVLATALR